MSFLGKKWVIKNARKEGTLIDKMLENRKLMTEEEKLSFFNYSLSRLYDPFLMKDMRKAVERIKKGIKDQEKIMIFGDYDVDGTSATAILLDFFTKVGACVSYTLPDREHDGYGLKNYFIERFADEGVSLVITVDCGTANVNEIALAAERGMDVIVTDHHDIPEVLPEACALINPKQPGCEYPNKELSGSGVAYKLVCAIAPYYFPEGVCADYLYGQMGIAVLGLVADCMQLTGENRILTNNGLKALAEGKNPGIRALLEDAGMKYDDITSSTIGFFIGPRINAAGRMDSAEHALELLLGNADKVSMLTNLNAKRQDTVRAFVEDAITQVKSHENIPKIIVVSSTEWNAGTLGLIAGKMVDIFHRPCIAMQEKEHEFVASCRSLNEFDITAFLRKEAGELFTTVGGHMLAGGFTLPKENHEKLMKVIEEKSAEHIDEAEFHGLLELECEVNSDELSFETTSKIRKFEPFGNGNPEPTLLIRRAHITAVKPVGKKGEHLQFPVQLADKKFQAIAFRFGEHLDKIKPENDYDIAFNLEINEWQGHKKLQLRVVDIKESS